VAAPPPASATPLALVGGASEPESALAGLDTNRVTRLARQALADDSASVVDWAAERLRYAQVAAASDSLFRVSGTARSGGATARWSLVLKVIKRPAGEEPSSEEWRREAEAYQSGLLSELPGGLAAPRCYDTVEQADGSIWLWLESVEDEYGGTWPLSRYGLAARHLGQFNGAFLTERPLAEAPWIARDFLCQWMRGTTAPARWQIVEREDVWAHPLVRRAFPAPITSRVQRLRRLIGPLLAAMERLPHTLCHQDAFSRNLLARRSLAGQEQTVAVDWADVGLGVIGGEAGQLGAATAVFLDVPSSDFARLHQVTFEGYLAGLADAGWQGDWRHVRLGYQGMFLTRWAGMVNRALRTATDERAHAAAEQLFGKPIAEAVLPAWAHLVYAQLDMMDEAEHLMQSL
jgi:hypothetical protein